MKKKCNGCKQWKDVETDFGKRKVSYKLVDGTKKTKRYPKTRCKDCEVKRLAGYRSRWRKEGRLRLIQAGSHVNRDVEAQKRYKRDLYRMKRAEQGHEVIPWKRYRHEMESQEVRVDRGPFDWYLQDFNGLSWKEMERITGVEESSLRKAKTLPLSAVDTIFTYLGAPDLVATLWPVDQLRRAA